jgi:hypothetical protein
MAKVPRVFGIFVTRPDGTTFWDFEWFMDYPPKGRCAFWNKTQCSDNKCYVARVVELVPKVVKHG